MPHPEPITLTLAELATRWNKSASQIIEQGLPMYFYFDGLVFEFGDKWHRANGEMKEVQALEAHQTRLATVYLNLQCEALYRRGLLKVTRWEEPLSDQELEKLQAESDHLTDEIKRLSQLLKDRNDERQRHVRNGLLRAAPRNLREIAQHGKSAFPQFAFMPVSSDENAMIAGGAVVALEDGFPKKDSLSEADLVVAMADVRAAETGAQS